MSILERKGRILRAVFLVFAIAPVGMLHSCRDGSGIEPGTYATYSVTYDGNGSTGGTVPADSNDYVLGRTVTVLGNTGNLAKTCYLFSDWNTRADGTGTLYAQDQTFSMGTADVTLYARWTDDPAAFRPAVFYVDPPVVLSGINTPVTVYAATIDPPLVSVSLAPEGQQGPAVNLNAAVDPVHQNRAKATIPNSLAAGTYDVILQDNRTCPGTMSAAVRLVDTLSVTITGVTPASGSTQAQTTITISSAAEYVQMPHVYLVPSTGGTAVPLFTTFLDASTLEAIVPGGLAVGSYNVVVVNPDGTAGILASGFTVTA